MCPRFPTILPPPLLTLTAASDSFLDTVFFDAGIPAFALETSGNRTSLSRCDAIHGMTELPVFIQWPATATVNGGKKEAQATVSIEGRSETTETVLKKSVMGNSRKVHIPGCSATLKWKKVGGHYEATLCSLACTTHTAVALFEPASNRLALYTASVYHDPLQAQYGGISLTVLEYIILSVVLLCTPVDDWRAIPNTSPFLSSHNMKNTFASQVLSSYKLDLLAPYSYHSSLPILHTPPASPPTAYTDIHLDTSRPPSPLHPPPPMTANENRRGSLPNLYANFGPAVPAQHLSVSLPSPSRNLSTPAIPTLVVSSTEAPPTYSEIEWTVRVPRRR